MTQRERRYHKKVPIGLIEYYADTRHFINFRDSWHPLTYQEKIEAGIVDETMTDNPFTLNFESPVYGEVKDA